MDLFNTLEEAAGLTGAPGVQAAGAPANQNAVAAVLQMLQAQPGGIPGVIQKFESAGLGGVIQSWISNATNQPVAPQQVQSALGEGAVGQVAQQLGISQALAATQIAQILPLVVDHLSPGGQAPNGSGMTELSSLLGRFTQTR